MGMIGDVTLDTIHAGLNGLNARRAASETPRRLLASG